MTSGFAGEKSTYLGFVDVWIAHVTASTGYLADIVANRRDAPAHCAIPFEAPVLTPTASRPCAVLPTFWVL